MRLKLELDSETTARLIEVGIAERRPACLQAEVILMRVLGTWQEPDQVAANTILDQSASASATGTKSQ